MRFTMMPFKWPLRFAGALIGGALAGAAIAATVTPINAAPTINAVSIENFSFKPGAITVPAGAHLVFANHDDVPHSIVIPDLKQRSKVLDTDDTYDAVLDKPGTYVFFLRLHPMMKGEITVTEH